MDAWGYCELVNLELRDDLAIRLKRLPLICRQRKNFRVLKKPTEKSPSALRHQLSVPLVCLRALKLVLTTRSVKTPATLSPCRTSQPPNPMQRRYSSPILTFCSKSLRREGSKGFFQKCLPSAAFRSFANLQNWACFRWHWCHMKKKV